ncbi:acylneuraminate cytidylyltransferase family protein [Acinetobacter sp. GXMZU3951]
MIKETVTCFLPCRKGSERVPRKNIKPFVQYSHGLIEVKLNQLIACPSIDEIILSTNDDEIIQYAESLSHPKIHLHNRIEELSSSQTSTDSLVAHAADLIPKGHILWTHVTSPFINAQKYEDIISRYFNCLEEGYDSLMTTSLLHTFLWQDSKPLNYDRTLEKWPRTQTLDPIHEVNSGVFLASTNVYKEQNDRIGERPYLFTLDKLVSQDVDWPEDFIIAEALVEKGLVSL